MHGTKSSSIRIGWTPQRISHLELLFSRIEKHYQKEYDCSRKDVLLSNESFLIGSLLRGSQRREVTSHEGEIRSMLVPVNPHVSIPAILILTGTYPVQIIICHHSSNIKRKTAPKNSRVKMSIPRYENRDPIAATSDFSLESLKGKSVVITGGRYKYISLKPNQLKLARSKWAGKGIRQSVRRSWVSSPRTDMNFQTDREAHT
jgi:hypothetical protein